jgi:hypothetical protein
VEAAAALTGAGWPFLLGSAFGVPIVDPGLPTQRRTRQHGALLVLYGLYALFRPALKPVAGAAADTGVG